MQGGSVSEVINFLFKKILAAGKDQVITLPLLTRYLRIVTDHTPRRWLKEARGQEHRKACDTEEKICMAINISWLTSHVVQNKYLHNKAELSAIRLHISRHTWVIKVLFTCLYPQKECKTVWILTPTVGEHGNLSEGSAGFKWGLCPLHRVSFSLKAKHRQHVSYCRSIRSTTKEKSCCTVSMSLQPLLQPMKQKCYLYASV